MNKMWSLAVVRKQQGSLVRDRRWLSIYSSSSERRKKKRIKERDRENTLPKPLKDIEIENKRKGVENRKPIWLVFDVNGTLCSKTKARKLREKLNINQRLWLRPRPYAGPLLQRLEESGHFRLALWSSARASNVEISVRLLELLSNIKFERVLNREHSIAVPTPENEYATVKPLHEMGFRDLSRVVLIEDEHTKAFKGEEKNLLLIPPWEENNDDKVLVNLTEALLRVLPGVDDVRDYTQDISESLKGFEGTPLPPDEW